MRRRVLLTGGMAALVAGAGVWLATRPPSPKVAPGAEMLAVLPFHTSGPGVEFLGEGMVDLLTTNLRGVGGINTVAPRAVLRQWSEASGGSDDLKRGLAVGRELDAGSVVLGSAVSTGGRVRLAADLYSISGTRLGRAQVDARDGQRAGCGGPAESGAAAGCLAVEGAVAQSAARLAHHRLDRCAPLLSPGRAVLSPAGLGLGTHGVYPGGGNRLDLCVGPSPAGADLRLDRRVWQQGRQRSHCGGYAIRQSPSSARPAAPGGIPAVRRGEARRHRFDARVRRAVSGGRRGMVPAGRIDVPHSGLPADCS